MMSLRILIVDDDVTIRTVLADLFHDEGYVVQIAANGRQALAAMAVGVFDVLLTDVAMPVMDGRQLARALRLQQNAVPIVVMTASRSIVETAHAMAAHAYLAKPLEFNLLLTTIERVVQGSVTP